VLKFNNIETVLYGERSSLNNHKIFNVRKFSAQISKLMVLFSEAFGNNKNIEKRFENLTMIKPR